MEQSIVNICGGLFICVLLVMLVMANAPYGYEDTEFHKGKPK